MTTRGMRPLVVGVAGATVFGCAALIARTGRVPAWEQSVFHWINDAPSWLYPPANVIQQAGNLAAVGVVAAGALVARRWLLAIEAGAAVVVKLAIEREIKATIVRQRPGTSIPGAILRGNVPAQGESFVSGHCIVVAMLAVMLYDVLPPRWRMVPVMLVPAVALCRVYVGAHAPLDTLGGVGVGAVIGSLLVAAGRVLQERGAG